MTTADNPASWWKILLYPSRPVLSAAGEKLVVWEKSRPTPTSEGDAHDPIVSDELARIGAADELQIASSRNHHLSACLGNRRQHLLCSASEPFIETSKRTLIGYLCREPTLHCDWLTHVASVLRL